MPGLDRWTMDTLGKTLLDNEATHRPNNGSQQEDTMLVIVLLIIAAVCFALATIGVTTRINLLAAGLLAWVLAALLPRVL